MIFVISGKARSGKDLSAKLLAKLLKSKNRKVKILAYADELKNILFSCFRLTNDDLYGNNKERKLKHLSDGKYGVWTPRKLMQYIGTDVFRLIDPYVWINIVRDETSVKGYDYIISDGRFSNEIDWVINDGGVHIHINRDVKNKISNKDHESENSIHITDDTYVIDNNSSIKNLKYKLKQIINNIGG
jgi:hypothetical protein